MPQLWFSCPDPAGGRWFKNGGRQTWFALFVIVVLVIGGTAVGPYSDKALIQIPTFLSMFSAAMVTINFMLAVLLAIKGTIGNDGNAIRLGAAYLYVSFIIIPQTASFPGGVMPVPLIGGSGSPVWIWCFWHAGFALAIIYYAWHALWPEPKPASVRIAVAVALAITLAATLLATTGLPLLPAFLADGHTLFSGSAKWAPVTVFVLTVAALCSVACLRARNPEQLWLVVGMVASCFDVWLTWHGTTRYTLGWYIAKIESLVASLTVLTSLIHDITKLYTEAAASAQAFSLLARKDGLTGIANRRAFDERLDQEFRRARRDQLPISLILLDVDCFKKYNDRYGHQAGDDCLRQVCEAVEAATLRPGDLVARYGGEEIAVLLPTIDEYGAMMTAERIRAAVQALGLAHRDSPFGITTVSAGVDTMRPSGNGMSPADLISAADAALYRAKAHGRNQVCSGVPDKPKLAGIDALLVPSNQITADSTSA